MRRTLSFLLLLLLLAPCAHGAANWRQVSTATTFNIGPLIKIADGAYEDAATITGISLSFIKQSATLASTVTTVAAAVSLTDNDCVFVAKGTYNCEASAGNTDTLGVLDIRATYTGTYGAKTSLQIVSANSLAVLQTGTITTAQGVWDVLTGDADATAGGMGELVVTRLDAAISSLIAYSKRMAGTTIATLASQTSGTLTAGSADDDSYNESMAIIIDQTTSAQQCTAVISDYVGSTKTFTLKDACTWTIATGDTIRIFGDRWSLLTVPKNVAYSNFTFKMYLSATGADATGLAPACTISKDGAAFAACTNTAAEIGTTGIYKVNLTQTEMNADEVWVNFTAATAREVDFKLRAQK